jgi:2-aminoethylphosphonate-pyruvate transaminase
MPVPIADQADTAREWASRRLVDLWVCYADGFSVEDGQALAAGLRSTQHDGAHVAVVGRLGAASSAAGSGPRGSIPEALLAVADLVEEGPAPPSPGAVTEAARELGLEDARRIGVLGTSLESLEAGHRAGAALVIGVTADAHHRRRLLGGQPDAIVGASTFASEDARRWGSRRRHRQRVLLNPGPTVVSDRIHRAMGGPDLCHREPEYSEIAERIEQYLLEAVEAPTGWRAVLLAGSGTSAMEAMVAASVRPDRRLLVVRNGTYGDRLALMAERHGIDHQDIEAEHWRPVDPRAVAAALDADELIDAVALVHHETTTGLLNPVAAVADVAHQRGRLVAVDAISALGAEEPVLGAGGIGFVAGTSNKCLQGLPGIAFVLLSPGAQVRAREARPKSLYLDLANYLAAAERGAPPFTPAIPAAYGLQAALEELMDEGPLERRQRYRDRMAHLDEAMDRLGLVPVVDVPDRSATVRAYPLPQGISYPELHDRLKAAGYVIYAGQGSGAAGQFRVCVLGEINPAALDGFIRELEAILA